MWFIGDEARYLRYIAELLVNSARACLMPDLLLAKTPITIQYVYIHPQRNAMGGSEKRAVCIVMVQLAGSVYRRSIQMNTSYA